MEAAVAGARRIGAMPFVAFGLALAASVGLLLAPLGEREESCSVTATSVEIGAADQPWCEDRVSHVNLLQQEGAVVVFILAVPVIVAGVGLALQRTRQARNAALVAGTLLVALSLVGIASIGVFYLPSGVAMFMAASHPPRAAGPG